MVPVFGSSPFLCQYASITNSTTSGWRSAPKELRRSIGTPSRTAMRAIATSSARRYRYRSRTARLNTVAAKGPMGSSEAGEIVVEVRAQALGEVAPGGPSDLDGRLRQSPQRPLIDCSRTGIPRSHHEAAGGIVRCPCRGLGAVAPIFVENPVIDRGWVDAAGRAVAYQAVQAAPHAACIYRSQNLAHRADRRAPRCGTPCSCPNHRSAARTLAVWFAKVLAVTPTRA